MAAASIVNVDAAVQSLVPREVEIALVLAIAKGFPGKLANVLRETLRRTESVKRLAVTRVRFD